MSTSLSRAITRACTSEPRISLTITTHPVVAVVVMVVGPVALRLWGAQDQCSIQIPSCAAWYKRLHACGRHGKSEARPRTCRLASHSATVSVAASSHLSQCCLLTALAAHWSEVGPRGS